MFSVIFRSRDFRPSYARLAEVCAFIPPNTPFMACTATVTKSVYEEIISILDMDGCVRVSMSPDRPNIYYSVKSRGDIESDFSAILTSLHTQRIEAPRVIVYCHILDSCADLYAHFHYELGSSSYYPPDAPHLSDNRLFGMYHACTPSHNKEVILQGLAKADGIIRVVFATMALVMGVDMQGADTIIHYGAPRSIDEFFQESGRGGRSGGNARSIIYWNRSDCPIVKEPTTNDHHDAIAIRRFLENTSMCRHKLLLNYFAPEYAKPGSNPETCCDICTLNSEETHAM